MRQERGAVNERFFVLSHEEMALAQAGRIPATATLPYRERVAALADGVDNVTIDHVKEHESAWEKIVKWCSEAV